MAFAYTKHLGERLRERKMTRSQVDLALSNPDSVTPSKGGKKYSKKVGNQTISVIVKIVERGQPLVVSAWIDPPNPGTRDERKKMLYTQYQRARGWLKWWYALRLAFIGK